VSVDAIAGGRYRVERVIGDGAMAKVVLARDGELGRAVAVKLLDERLADDESFRARFAREARLAAALSHANIVTVFDAGETEGRPYIVMEYVEGRSLAERLQQEGPLPPEEVRRIAIQVCAGLEHAHLAGLIHRDLKPGNLIERRDGAIKIADFGIARTAETTELTEAGTIVGTAAYLAPEQAEGGEITPATDLFALGVVLYELLTGQRPWKIETLADLGRRTTEPVRQLSQSVPASLRDAVERCLQRDPEDRPPSAAELARSLEDRPDAAATVVLPRAQRRRRAPRRRASPAPWIAAVLSLIVLVLAALALAIASRGDGESPRAPASPIVQPVPDGATPSEDARNLAAWLRENRR
jgi:eukaryotic-like serine/threonine-protein kinase